MKKTDLINNLISVFWKTQYHPKPSEEFTHPDRPFVSNKLENAYLNTIKGFKGELEFTKDAARFLGTVDGGWFIPFAKSTNPLVNSLYLTISDNQIESLVTIYEALAQSFPDKFLYVASVPELSASTEINKSIYSIYRFNALRNQFDNCSLEELLDHFSLKPEKKRLNVDDFNNLQEKNSDLYEESFHLLNSFQGSDLYKLLADRYLFDVIISGTRFKGRSTDIDAIKVSTNPTVINFLDIKNKTRNYKGKVGHNEDHLPFWIELHNSVKANNPSIGVRTSYVLRDQDENDESKIWKWTPMQLFMQKGDRVLGSPGRNAQDEVYTYMLSVEDHFRLLL